MNAMNATKTETQDGMVTLRGEAVNQAEKGLASKLTRDIKDVKSVNNRMTLRPWTSFAR
jgi:osmotically-inducible protein OsmY